MNYSELTPKTVQKLREIVGSFKQGEQPIKLEINVGPGIRSGSLLVRNFHAVVWARVEGLPVYPCVSFVQSRELNETGEYGGEVTHTKEETYYLPKGLEDKALELSSKVGLLTTSLSFLHQKGVESLYIATEILGYIDNAIPFDPTNYTEEISSVMKKWERQGEYKEKMGLLHKLSKEVEEFKQEVIRRQAEAKPEGADKPKPEADTLTPTPTPTQEEEPWIPCEGGDSMRLLATVCILLAAIYAFVTYLKTL